MASPFRVIQVAAVSTVRQAAEDKESVPEQIRLMDAVCEARGWQVVERITIPGHSRDYTWLHQLTKDCPEYAHLVDLIEAETGNLVMCAWWNRLWRTSHLQSQLMTLCREHGVQVYAVNQPVELLPPDKLPRRPGWSALVPVISGLQSDEDQNRRVSDWRMGMAGRHARGLHNAAILPYGYDRNPLKGQPMLIDKDRARWVRWIYARRAEGWGYHMIQHELDTLNVAAPRSTHWVYRTVRTILHNPVYVGVVVWEGHRNDQAKHAAILDHDLWLRAQVVNDARSAFVHGRRYFILSGLVHCAECGWAMGYAPSHNRYHLFCNQYRHTGGRVCHPHAVHADEIESYVRDAVLAALQNPAAYLAAIEAQTVQTSAEEVAALGRQEADLLAAVGRWDTAYEQGAISLEAWLLHHHRIDGARETVRLRREALATQAQRQQSRRETLLSLHDAAPRIASMTTADLRALYGALLRRITYTDPQTPPRIEWL